MYPMASFFVVSASNSNTKPATITGNPPFRLQDYREWLAKAERDSNP
jgi:hypothetical protein